jgi:hypothetical protein
VRKERTVYREEIKKEGRKGLWLKRKDEAKKEMWSEREEMAREGGKTRQVK